jgi:hypothetical protein
VDKESTREMQGAVGTGVRLRGRVLLLARVIWLAFVLFNLILMSIKLLQQVSGGQLSFRPFTFTCPADSQTLVALQQAHISLPAYTSYVIVLGVFSASLFIFRKSLRSDRMQ